MERHRCETADFSFAAPSDWIDRTVMVWTAPPDGSPAPPNLVIAYDKPKQREPLDAYVDRQLTELRPALKGFNLHLRREITLGGRPCLEVILRWQTPGGTMQQRQIYCELTDGRIVNVATTATVADFPMADEEFRTMLRSFEWRD